MNKELDKIREILKDLYRGWGSTWDLDEEINASGHYSEEAIKEINKVIQDQVTEATGKAVKASLEAAVEILRTDRKVATKDYIRLSSKIRDLKHREQ